GRVVTSLRGILMASGCGLKDGRVLFLRWMLHGPAEVSQLCEMRTDPKTGEVFGPPHPVTQSGDWVRLSSISAAYDGSKVAVVRSSEQQNANIYIADLPAGKDVSKLLNIR